MLLMAYTFFIFVETFQWTSSERFFYFKYYSRKSWSQQKLVEKITYFTIQFCSNNLTRFTNLSSLDIENNMLPQLNKNLSDFTNFLANLFLFGVRKNICTAALLDAQELYSLVLWKDISVYFCIPVNNFCSEDEVRFFLIGNGMGGGWIISSWWFAV